MKLDLAKRRIKTELERLSDLKTKNLYIQQKLADVIDKYAENFIRRINITIRLFRDADVEKAIGDLRKLHGLVDLDVTVSLSKYCYDSTLGLKYLDLLQPLLRELRQKGHDVRIIA
ncbi:hypothetical protein J4E91_004659 [Alternaria rosae]|nr:hypothetical protein J4E91_004659 [Alternaria rosae]